MRRSCLLVPLVLFSLAACGGGNGHASSATQTPDLTNLESRAGVTHCDNGGGQLFAREGGQCRLSGQEVQIQTFTTAANRDRWLNTAEQFGGIFVVGDLWVAAADSRPMAARLQSTLGGELR